MNISEALRLRKHFNEKAQDLHLQIAPFINRPSDRKDPKETAGGSVEFCRRIFQGLEDITTQRMALHEKIMQANHGQVEINGVTRSVHSWNHYRDVVGPEELKYYAALQGRIAQIRAANYVAPRTTAIKRGTEVATAPVEEVINVDEEWLTNKVNSIKDTLHKIGDALNVFNLNTNIKD